MNASLYTANILVCLTLPAQTPVPKASELYDAPGHAILFRLRTLPTSVQIYTCKATAGAFAWTGPDPDAIVANSDNTLTLLHHYKGPTWEATDGSIVRGSNAKHFLSPKEKSVDWLELTAVGGTQKFASVDLIHRIDTSGGVPPSQPCDAAHDLEQVRVPYSATYLFYAAKN
jgi:Protein of unknown function (DUF3455)